MSNQIQWIPEARYNVNCVRTNHHEYVVLVTVNGKVIIEKCFVGPESLPRQKEVFKLREKFKCEYVSNDDLNQLALMGEKG